MRRFFGLLTVTVLAILCSSAPIGWTAPRNAAFATPPEMRARVDFWKDVFTRYGKYQAVVHHRDFPGIRFDVLDFSSLVGKMNEVALSKHMKARKKAAEKAISAVITRLGKGLPPRNRFEEDIEEKMSALGPGLDKYKGSLHDGGIVRTQTGIKERYAEAVKRSGRYIHIMEDIFVKKHGLPVELTRLPFVESSFDYRAYSSVGAAGIWQFMPATGRTFGLKVGSTVDERRDIILASQAAAKYLKQAYRSLGTWPMALTSYNHGVAGVRRKIKKLGSKSIVKMVESKDDRLLGFASNNFYPEFLAALEIYEEWPKYFPGLRRDAPRDLQTHVMEHPMSVAHVAKTLAVDPAILKDHNYALGKTVWRGSSRIPRGYRLRVPTSSTVNFASLRKPEPGAASSSPIYGGGVYIVRRGDTLGKIARRYNTSVSAIKSLNRLRSDTVYVGQRLKLKSSTASSSSRASLRPASAYTVKRGDTLTSIARKTRTTVANLKQLNKLRSGNIWVGQRLKVPGTTSSSPVYHKVGRGDTLSGIASRYRVSQSQIKARNKLKGSTVRLGQRLRIR